MSLPTSNPIAALNDEFRKDGPFPAKGPGQGRWVFTEGVTSRGVAFLWAVILAVEIFNAFTEDNDPYAEHDFGAVDVRGERIFWKIDYYDRSLRYASPDPTDPSVTMRILTVMLAEEY